MKPNAQKDVEKITPVSGVVEITSNENPLAVVTIDNGVIVGNTIARYAKVCADNAYVYGSPKEMGEPLYLLSIGDKVEIHDVARNTPEVWVMVQPAEWLKMTALCGNK